MPEACKLAVQRVALPVRAQQLVRHIRQHPHHSIVGAIFRDIEHKSCVHLARRQQRIGRIPRLLVQQVQQFLPILVQPDWLVVHGRWDFIDDQMPCRLALDELQALQRRLGDDQDFTAVRIGLLEMLGCARHHRSIAAILAMDRNHGFAAAIAAVLFDLRRKIGAGHGEQGFLSSAYAAVGIANGVIRLARSR